MKHLMKFNEMSNSQTGWGKYKEISLPVISDVIVNSVKEQDFSILPEWVWNEVEKIYPLEERWEVVTTTLNRDRGTPDPLYWSEPSRKEEYESLMEERDNLEKELSIIAKSITDRLVEWRNSLMPDPEDYDEKIANAVAYFIMSLQRGTYKDELGWYKEHYTSKKLMRNYKDTQNRVRELLKKKGKL